MLYALLVIASLYSNYMMAMENEFGVKNQNKKILTLKKDHAEIAQQKDVEEGYAVSGEGIIKDKDYYDKIIAENIQDKNKIAKYKEGYYPLHHPETDELLDIIPLPDIFVPVPIGNSSCFISLPYFEAMDLLEQQKKYKEEISKAIAIENK